MGEGLGFPIGSSSGFSSPRTCLTLVDRQTAETHAYPGVGFLFVHRLPGPALFYRSIIQIES